MDIVIVCARKGLNKCVFHRKTSFMLSQLFQLKVENNMLHYIVGQLFGFNLKQTAEHFYCVRMT